MARRIPRRAIIISAMTCLLGNLSQGAITMKHAKPGEQAVHISSGRLNLKFDIIGEHVTFDELSDASGLNRLAETAEPCTLWRIEFRGPDGASKEVGSGEIPVSEAGNASFTWSVPLGAKTARVRMTVRMERGNPISYWSLDAKLPAGWKVVRADFPIVSGVKLERGLKFAAPAGWGVEYDVKPGVRYEGTYPSCVAAMQFGAFYVRGRGLYVAAHDPQANHKVLRMRAGDSGAEFAIINWPAIPEKGGGTYKLPYEAAIGVFAGDYYDAGQIYREFTFKTPWGKAGPVSKRPIPKWVKDTDLWLRPDGSAEENVEITKQALKYFDVPTSLHWYRWHVIPYDTLYPEYFPPLPGFAEGIRELQQAGSHVMPYINGRLCDPNSKTWTDERGSESAARQENGEPYTEVYGSKVPLNVMCPYTAQWQEKVTGLVDRLIREVGVDGVYIDQISAAHPVRCFNPNHGHPIGGGRFWVDGYRKLLDLVRAKLPKDHMITTEESAECWIDQFDALLLVNTPITAGTPIPLFPAVYSGRTITFGFLYFPKDDLERSLPFRAKMARCFVFGSQLGWIQPKQIMQPEFAKEAEFLRNLAKCRRSGHKYLAYGKFLGLLSVRGDNPRAKGEGSGSFGGSYKIDMLSVIGSSWLAEDGSVGLALANLSDAPHEVQVKGRKVTIPARGALIIST